MKQASVPVQQQLIQQLCKQLRMPTVAAQFQRLAEESIERDNRISIT